MELLCAFVRTPPFPNLMPEEKPREDVQTALDVVIYRSDQGIEIEKSTATDSDPDSRFRINLQGAYLKGAGLANAKLRDAILDGVWLEAAHGMGADLAGSSLYGAKLHNGARFVNEACFNDADMLGVNMSGSAFHGARFVGTRLGSDLSDSNFLAAIMSKADFGTSNLENANMHYADLSDAKFGEAFSTSVIQQTDEYTDVTQRVAVPTGERVYCRVTQRQLDAAIADPNDPPDIAEGTTDIKTGKPIVWNRDFCGDRWIEQQKNLNPEQDATGIGPQGLRALWPFRH